MMKTNWIRKTVVAAALACAVAPGAASAAFMTNWKLNLDGAGVAGAKVINEYLDFTGTSLVQTTGTPYPNFNFKDDGAYNIITHDGGANLLSGFTAKEMTGLYSGGTGTGALGGAINFNAGGLLNLYSDAAAANFATSTVPGFIYGANDGTKIGSFTQVAGGGGTVDPTGIPNGFLTLIFQATDLAANTWFDSAGNDLRNLVLAGTPVLFGFVTTNASAVANPSATVLSDIVGAGGQAGSLAGCSSASGCFTNTAPHDFVVSNNGQFRLSVPEPGTVFLMGVGLLGLSLNGMRRFRKMS